MKFNKIIKYEFKITFIITKVYVCEWHAYVVVHDMTCMSLSYVDRNTHTEWNFNWSIPLVQN